MYIFIHSPDPGEVVRLSEAIQYGAFGKRTLRSDIYVNAEGDMRIVHPPEANGDGVEWGKRIHRAFAHAQHSLGQSELIAIAQSPVNGRWVRVPSDYWIRHNAACEVLELGADHELESAPIVVEAAKLPEWRRVLQEVVEAPSAPAKPRRRLDRRQSNALRFFILAGDKTETLTQERLHASYLAWHAKQKLAGEPFQLAAFKKWLVRYREGGMQ